MKIKNRILLITGGTGSFGNAVLNRFLNTDHFLEIRIFSRDEKKQDDLRRKFQNEKIKYFIGDVRDKDRLIRAFEGNNISNYDLSNLQFHFPSVNKSFDYEIENNFVKSYKVKYGAEPNRYATRGFDLTFDLLLRLSTQDDLFDASSSDIETEYIENKFRYSKKLFGGYINEASYIMKYEDLKLIEVKQ